MPIARFQMPDGRVARFDVPDGTSPEDAQKIMQDHFAPKDTNWGRVAATAVGGTLGGMVAAPAAGLAAIPTAGLGGLATEAAGIGLGAGIGGQLYDLGSEFFGGKQPPQTFKERAKEAVTDVGLNAAVAPVVRAASAGFKMAAPYVEPYVRPVLESIPGTMSKAQRLAKGLVQKATQTGEDISYTAAQQKAGAEAVAAEAGTKAGAAEAQINAMPVPTPRPQPIMAGQAREATAEIGAPVQREAANEQRNIIAKRVNNDAVLRQSRDAIVADNEADGVQMMEQPSYQAIIKKAEPIANWERSGTKVPDKSVANTYKELLNRISPQTVELSAEDAAIASKNNIPIRQDGDKFYRDVKPTFESIDNARRFLGEVFSGKAPAGYGAIKGQEQKDLYGLLSKAEEEYAGSAQPRLQANWRDVTAKINAFKEGVGPKIIKSQPEKITPTIFSNKGAGAFDDAVAATNSERIPRKALSDQLATDMAGKDYKGSVTVYNRYKQVLQNPKLADLKARVESHLSELNDNEIAGVETKNITLGARQQVKEQTQLAAQKTGEATKAASRERIHSNAVSDIVAASEKDPKAGADKAIAYLKRLADGGQISTDEYRAALNDYNKTNFAKPEAVRASVKKWLKRGGYGLAAAVGATKLHYIIP